jgi:Chalcone isomerase-like
MNRTRIVVPIALILLTGLASSPAHAGEAYGITVPDSVEIGGQQLVLNGMGLRKVTIIKVYVAGLWLPTQSTDGAAVLAADTSRHAEMHWLRGGGHDRICDGWYEGLEANTPDASAALREQFDALCEWMPDAEKGDVFALTYQPGSGTEVRINDQLQGVIPGKEFADALWACWLGPHPGPGETFKRDLLGG